MTGPRWRGDPNKIDMRREWIRVHMPNGSGGFVAEDLDLVLRWFDSRDPVGLFRLVELKTRGAALNTAQQKTFRLIDSLLQDADPARRRYDGFYLIQTNDEDWFGTSEFRVNGVGLDVEDFRAWMHFRLDVPALWETRMVAS